MQNDTRTTRMGACEIQLFRIALLLLLLIGLLPSCGRKREIESVTPGSRETGIGTPYQISRPATGITLKEAWGEIAKLQAPEEVDTALFVRLRAELEGALLARGLNRFPAKAPTQDPLNGIVLTASATGLSWNEARAGDWNNDGLISAQDLSPLALYFGKKSEQSDPDYYKYAEYIDGNNDGIINEGDVTAIAFHFGESTGGYNIYEAQDGSGTGAVKVASITRPPVPDDPDNLPANKSLATLQYDTGTGGVAPLGWKPKVGKWYRVVPYDNTFAKQESETVSSPWLLRREVWVHSWGGKDPEVPADCAVGPSGEVFVAGSINTGATSYYDGLSLKYDSSGNVLWAKSYGGPSSDGLSGVAADTNGDSYWVGTVNSFGAGMQDLLILKRDEAGNLLWAKTWGGYDPDFGDAVALDEIGNVYIAGSSFSYAPGGALLLKYNSAGDFLWARIWAGSFTAGGQPSSVAVDSASNIYVTGDTVTFGAGGVDVFIMKFDKDGNLIWVRTYGTPGLESAKGGIALDTNGNLYIAGVSYYSNSFNDDVLLIKFSKEGELVWDRAWGLLRNEWGTDIAVGPDGNLFIAGPTDSFLPYGEDFLLSYDIDGNIRWAKTWGPSQPPIFSDLALAFDTNGDLYISSGGNTIAGLWLTQTGYSRPVGGTTTSPVAPFGAVTGIENTGSGTETSLTGETDVGGKVDALLRKNYY